MTWTPELLQKLIGVDRYPESAPDIASHLAAEMKRIEGIEDAIDSLKWEYGQAHEICNKEVERINKEREKVQATCRHEATQDHSSGVDSNDSWSECLICGASV